VTCSECGAPDGLPITEADFSSRGSERLIAGSGGGSLGVLAFRVSRRFAVRRFEDLTFCGKCRSGSPSLSNPFQSSKICAATGFFLGLSLVGFPLAFLLQTVSFVLLRKRLRELRARPRASSIRPALDAVGTLTLAFAGTLLLLAVMGGVVAYMVYVKP
jgi:hypothetical protein